MIEENVLLLDVGDTLVSITKPFEFYTEKAISGVLKEHNLLDDSGLSFFVQHRNQIRARAHETEIETTIAEFIKTGFKKAFSIELSEGQLDELELLYIREELNVTEIFNDSVEFLTAAKKSGRKLFLTSNNFSEQHVLALIKQFELAPFLSGIHISAVCGYRKPHPGFLHSFFKKFDVKLADAVIIGDKYEMDVLCGKTAGIKTCLINRTKNKIEYKSGRPDYEYDSLSSIKFV